MAERLILLTEAVRDIADAYQWYERRSPGLGRRFVESVEFCLDAIQRSPDMYAFAYKTYRRAKLRRFPYLIFYEHTSDAVTVYSVFHTARDPRHWRDRLP